MLASPETASWFAIPAQIGLTHPNSRKAHDDQEAESHSQVW